MKSTKVNRVAITAMTLALVLAGCGSDTTENTSSPTQAGPTPSVQAGPTAPGAGPAAPGGATPPPPPSPALPAGMNRTLLTYIKQNSIGETSLKRGEPGTPNIGLPLPPGWVDAGADTPAFAYSAIVYTGPEAAEYTPNFTAILSKLTGNVDTQSIIGLAPGELKNLAGFTPAGGDVPGTLAGFPAVELRGTWNAEGKIKFVAQKTVVMPAPDGLYVLQLNADGLDVQAGVLNPASDAVYNDTTITLP